jgi:Fe-S-cluster containining protein
VGAWFTGGSGEQQAAAERLGTRRRVRYGADVSEPADRVTFATDLRVGDEVLHVTGSVPRGDARVADLLPAFQRFTDAVTAAATRRVEADGARISCRAGCGACCRQLVPIGEAEARRLAEVVAAMPAERQAHVRARFAAALAALERDGLLERLRHPETIDSVRAVGLEYFARGVACPFLEDESCSIHPERPASCREYLVTSPPERCADPGPGRIALVPLPARVSQAIHRLREEGGDGRARWVPLVLALEWAAAHAAAPPPMASGMAILERFMAALAGSTS